ncbi:uncharacterized protein LOC108744392 isoform X2 [Agrilus planipennis]|uniref:Uncharacterized protein LOC108744392 isoform X2 n=1 Tax=Agrilus planipennis TaxID=224129 RepID=A0A1W4XHN0_AGRPL|nr:uncharacterized protein LOC108744392 isoform X2 [Agrilus planipennis]
MAQQKRKVFNIEEKAHIVWRLENGESNTSLAKEYGISRSTISSIWKNRDKIRNFYQNNYLNMKRARSSDYKPIEDALLEWFKSQRADATILNGPVLQEKANEIARSLGKTNFNCSSSWIQRFRVRHNIIPPKKSGTLVNTEDKNETIGLEDFENRNEDVVISGSSEKHNDDHNLDNIERVVVQVKNETEVSNTFYTEMVKSEDNGKKTKSMEGNGTSKGFADGLGNVRIKEENEEEGADIILPEIVTLEDENQPKRSTKEATITKPSETNDDDDLLFFKSLLPDLRSLSRERKLYIRNKIQLLILNEVYGYRIENT